MKEEKIKVLLYNSTLILGGTDIYMLNLAENIDKTKFDVDVLIKSNKESNEQLLKRLIKANCNVFLGQGNVFKQMKYMIAFFKQNKNKYDIIHINASSKSHGLISYFAKHYGKIKRVIFHSHMGGNKNSNSLLKKIGEKLMINFSTDFVSCSNKATAHMFKNVKDKVTVFNNSIDLEKLKYNADVRNELRHDLKISDEFTILHVGRFDENKNQKRLLSIVNKYKNEHDAKIKLILVGSGDLEKEVKLQAEELSISENLIFMGQRNDVDKILQAADMFIMPSYYEGLPISAVEAQASGLPVIFSDTITKDAQLIPNVKFCSLASEDKVWCDAIIELKNIYLNNIKETRNTSKYIIDRKFDNKSAIQQIEKFYQEIIGE